MTVEFVLNHPWELGLLSLVLLAGALEGGLRTAKLLQIQKDEARRDQLHTIRDGLFLLVSLLLGFTLALAAPRYAERRTFLVEEVNAIGTTYLRTETLSSPHRERAQGLLRQYVDVRLDLFKGGADVELLAEHNKRAKEVQDQLWLGLVQITKTDRSAVTAEYMRSLNELIDLQEKRTAARENRIPHAVWLLILCVSTMAVFARGMTLTRRFWMTFILVPITIAIVIGLIADVDAPFHGLIQTDSRPMLRLKADLAIDGAKQEQSRAEVDH